MLDHAALSDVCGQKNQLYRWLICFMRASIRHALHQCIYLSGLSTKHSRLLWSHNNQIIAVVWVLHAKCTCYRISIS